MGLLHLLTLVVTVRSSLHLFLGNSTQAKDYNQLLPINSSLPTFPNIGYLGRGYDVVSANPNPSQGVFDPGWKPANLFDYSYAQNRTTADNRFAIPDSVNVLNTGACFYSVSFEEIRSSYEYQQSSQSDVSLSGSVNLGLVKAKFSGSADYKQASKDTDSGQSIYVSTKAACDNYHAGFREYISTPLSEEFINAVKQMPTAVTDENIPVFVKFVEYFGTHYTSEIKMGGKAVYTMVFDTYSYSEMKSSGIDVKAAASVSYGVFGGVSASAQHQANQQNYQAFSNTSFTKRQSCVGANGQCPKLSTGPSGGVIFDNTWAKEVHDDPLPIAYTLASVDTLLTSTYFPDDPNIAAKQNALYTFYADHYCGKIADCVPPVPTQFWGSISDMGRAAPPNAGSPTPRAGLGVAVLGTKLYAVGGVPSKGVALTTAEVYDPSTNSWASVASMGTARSDLGVAVLGTKLYAVGGYDDNFNHLATVEVYDPSTNSWASVASMSTARIILGVAVLGTKLYAVGGRDANSGYQATVEVYDPSTNSWAFVASMSTARCYLGVAVLGTKLYAVGGGYPTALPIAEVYDPSTNSWASVASMSTARAFLGVAVLGTKLYAVGGHDDNFNFLATAEVYDPSTNSWASVASMSTARSHLGVAVLGTKLYAVGGSDDKYNNLATVEVYDPSTNSWSFVASMSTARCGLGVAVLGTKLYAVGGWDLYNRQIATAEVFTNDDTTSLSIE